MKAIMTKVLAPTDTKGKRVTASDGDGNRVTIGWRYDKGEMNYLLAAQALCEILGGHGTLHGGNFAGGMVWVWDDPKLTYRV